ncbi:MULTISPECIES: TRAP transporter large permease [Bacillaceae]|uniref:TRAP transporter large permease n=1 Tax=Bacillaceae TaxID=186817 RepID=UPI0006F4C08A|nr:MULTISPECIES: TRAP transporter large permease [Bacillaceae]KQL35725.1 C4-dicarboxylate ABC transporter permease [Psychrobacillus sp. FJAT-21963]MDF2067133.1 TRAP transporter large permease [Bacillus sp. Cr_A10]
MSVAIPLILLLLFLAFGMPIAFALGIAGSIGLLMNSGWDSFLGIMQTAPYDSVKSFIMTSIPMFILMASLMTVSGIMKDLFQAAYKWLGKLPGGLGIATVFAGAMMASVSGSSQASAAAMSKAAAPEMKKYNYDTAFTMGVVSMAGTLAVMIPPSIILILYGILTETGVGSLLIAGIIPGVLTALGYIIVIFVWVKFKPEIAPKIEINPTIKEKFVALKNIWPMLIIILAVIGGIYSGLVTATEAGAMGAFITLVVVFIMGRMNLNKFGEALTDTIKSTTMIMTIIIGAHIFSYFLTLTQSTQRIVGIVEGLDTSKYWILAIIIIIYLILGFFMDQIAILILTLPLTFPIITSLGFDPVWFGIIVTKTVEIGLVTPPVGMNVFVATGAAGVKTAEGFKGVTWFVIMDLFILVLLILMPFITLWLPELMIK